MRRFPLALTLCLVTGFVLGQAPLGLEDALDLAVEVAADVRSVQLDLASAERDRERIAADPTTLRVARLEADHAVDRARTGLQGAEAAARDAAASAYAAALEADDRLAIAEAALAIATTTEDAMRIQFEAGAATRLDLERTENDRSGAERDVADARATRVLAFDRLTSLLGLVDPVATLARAPEPEPVAPLEDFLADLERNAQLLAAAQRVELAEAQLAAVDNPLSSARADISAARDRLETARLQRDEQRRGLTLFARQAHNAALAAQARLRSAEAAVATARDDADVQRVRFEAGSISALALARTEQQLRSQEAELAAARHAVAAAIRQVELTVLGAS